ncbi:predicted protein [Lodderomyces elongisporus NRRL YB-4239]|uniref:Uncharacterized protein n=1 Tax=Lodderomyces elongisporus (strain ATCC 11503 / CBS 2605 / JCM 1781 / NBRC 1676 / NRRL YB-4239) TaxID=379508 RepID=A5DZU4_LODEL|nr:predicted protein [Lodderomyces elongisporus NRRL YB-4239]
MNPQKKKKGRDTKDRLLMRFSVGSGVEATLFVNVLRLSLKFDCFCLPNNIYKYIHKYIKKELPYWATCVIFFFVDSPPILPHDVLNFLFVFYFLFIFFSSFLSPSVKVSHFKLRNFAKHRLLQYSYLSLCKRHYLKKLTSGKQNLVYFWLQKFT